MHTLKSSLPTFKADVDSDNFSHQERENYRSLISELIDWIQDTPDRVKYEWREITDWETISHKLTNHRLLTEDEEASLYKLLKSTSSTDEAKTWEDITQENPAELKADLLPNISKTWRRSTQAVLMDIFENVGEEGTYNATEASERLGYCPETIRRQVRCLDGMGFIQKVKDRNGQGRGQTLRVIWLINRRRIKDKISQAVGRRCEDEYLRTALNRQGKREFSSTTIERVGSFEKNKALKDGQDARKNSNFYFTDRKNKSNVENKTKVLWQDNHLRNAVMGNIRRLLWLNGQNGDRSEGARVVNQRACNAIGRLLKIYRIPIDTALDLVEKVRDEAKIIISDAENCFGDVLSFIRDFLPVSCSSSNNQDQGQAENINFYRDIEVFCRAEDGEPFTSEDYDSEAEALRAKAKHNREISTEQPSSYGDDNENPAYQ